MSLTTGVVGGGHLQAHNLAALGPSCVTHLQRRMSIYDTRGLGCRWVEEYHVDGFRFDLASALCRDPLGAPIPAPPLIRQIAKDPVLSKARFAPH